MSKKLKLIRFHDRASEFKDDMYPDGHVLFCKYCQHSVGHVRVHTIKLHLTSAKHVGYKSRALGAASVGNGQVVAGPSGVKQVSIAKANAATSSGLRREFNHDLVWVMAHANIPLEKVEKLRPFLLKYCRQGGACPTTADDLHKYSDDVYISVLIYSRRPGKTLTKNCILDKLLDKIIDFGQTKTSILDNIIGSFQTAEAEDSG